MLNNRVVARGMSAIVCLRQTARIRYRPQARETERYRSLATRAVISSLVMYTARVSANIFDFPLKGGKNWGAVHSIRWGNVQVRISGSSIIIVKPMEWLEHPK
ncbi:hypothetical protein CDAR_503121 [Caerostris darwini]|uniref:Uncharacterized protein n=1 Tax=Caerostris darwini TaxID=1538125 RepID=A0AAV4VMC9_9ARAC|nr:hypothetical protein CDAR_503121 [Caerostris darwini]